MSLGKNSKRQVWREAQVEEFRKQIKLDLESRFGTGESQDRLNYILEQINQLQSQPSSDAQLKCVILCTSALVWHERFGGLREKDLKLVIQLATAILRVQGVNHERSRFRQLYRDIFQLESQILRKQGKHWDALWTSISSRLQFGKSPDLREALVVANRKNRMGMLKESIDEYQKIISAEQVDSDLRKRAAIEVVRGLRLMGEVDSAELHLIKFEKFFAGDQKYQTEAEWEKMCVEAVRTGNVLPLVLGVRKSKPHHQAGYILEAMLWAHISSRRDTLTHCYSIENLVRNRELRIQDEGLMHAATRAIARSMDSDVGHAIRIEDLGECLRDRNQLLTIDKELLFLAAASRCLLRLRSYELFSVCLSEYHALSLRLSAGKTSDVLRLLNDVRMESSVEDTEIKSAG